VHAILRPQIQLDFPQTNPCIGGTKLFFEVIEAIVISVPCVFAVRAILSIVILLPRCMRVGPTSYCSPVLPGLNWSHHRMWT